MIQLVYNKKIKLIISKEQALQLDGQSKKCNWLYNKLYEFVEKDYEIGSPQKLLNGRNLRDLVPKIKQHHSFLYKVHSSPLKNVAFRLKNAYELFFDSTLGNKKPHYRSWKKKWFSLFYDEPGKGFNVIGNHTLNIKFGQLSKEEYKKAKKINNNASKTVFISVSFTSPFQLEPNEKIKTLRITKEMNSYYAVFTVEQKEGIKQKDLESFIVFDPNHKNLAVGIGSDGKSYELVAMKSMLKYWDQRIDEIKSKRDKCVKQSKLVITPNTEYWQPSNRWERLNRSLEKVYLQRREQIKLLLYRYAHFFSRRYDEIYIGDYVPTIDVAKYKNMHRAMLNQTPIGQFRTTLAWVQLKNGKHYEKVNERNTTKDCCECRHQEKKDPSVRIFTCVNCGTTLSRDLNSVVNIADKVKKILPRSGYMGMKNPMYTVWWDYKQGKVSCGLTPNTGSSK